MGENASVQQSGITICRNPATGETLGESALTRPEEVGVLIERARGAQRQWAGQPVRERTKYMLRVRDYLVQRVHELSEVIARDNGKTRVDALSTELLPAVMAVDYYARHAAAFLRERFVAPGNVLLLHKLTKIFRTPYGVIGVISPWNYPFSIPFSEVVMGLLAGNAVVLKTATETQMVGRELERCFAAAGLPEGIFTYVNLPGWFAGSAFLQGGIDKLFFTGSVETGKRLMAEAAGTLTPVVLELGGNDAMLVCSDADLYRAAAGAAWAGLQNSGQSCGGVERVYVHQEVYEPFLELLKAKVEGLRAGYDRDFDVDLGVMTTERQLEKVKSHLEDALARGARIYAQTLQAEPGKYSLSLPGMVLTEVNHDMLMMREETFGPLLGVMKVHDMEEALSLANDSQLGLTGSVWSRNRKGAEKLARQIRAGVVTINDHLMSHGMAEAPWGGLKQSGIGRTHGAIGFDEMTQPQVIVHDVLPFARQNMWWYPHGEKVYRGLAGAIQLLYGKSFVERLRGLRRVLKVVPRYFRAD